jgi:hypothetical protein
MNKRLSLVSALVVLITAAVLVSAAEKIHVFSLHGIKFKTGIEFSPPARAGVDALMMLHPRNAKPGKEKLGITAVLYTRDTQKLMGMGDPGLLNYTRSVFLGVAAAGKPIERVLAGKSVRGDVVEKKIPAPMTVETYVLTLSNGSKVGIAFSYSPQFKTDADRVIAEIGASMKE